MPEFYIYEYDVLAERVQKNYEAYMNKPKRDGNKRKEVGFRWHDTKYFTDDDHARKNTWKSIINALNKGSKKTKGAKRCKKRGEGSALGCILITIGSFYMMSG